VAQVEALEGPRVLTRPLEQLGVGEFLESVHVERIVKRESICDRGGAGGRLYA
jgi:hypothetical protein